MFGDLDWPLNALRGLSAIAKFLVLTTTTTATSPPPLLLVFVQSAYFSRDRFRLCLVSWTIRIAGVRFCTHQMPFLSPNWQCQSTDFYC